jgi:cytidylate kinase
MSEKKPMRQIVIAIDGPAASGKSTTAREVARRLGLMFLDTGAMYRAVTLKAMREGIDLKDGDKVTEMTRRTQLELSVEAGEQRVLLDGEDVTVEIRRPDVTTGTTPVSGHRQVREILVGLQRQIGAKGGVVAEGRDTTSVVFPDADVKIFLSAAIDARAIRRVKDLELAGAVTTPNEQSDLLSRRDQADSSRPISPLTRVSEAVEIDTSRITIEQQVQRVIELAREVAEV